MNGALKRTYCKFIIRLRTNVYFNAHCNMHAHKTDLSPFVDINAIYDDMKWMIKFQETQENNGKIYQACIMKAHGNFCMLATGNNSECISMTSRGRLRLHLLCAVRLHLGKFHLTSFIPVNSFRSFINTR